MHKGTESETGAIISNMEDLLEMISDTGGGGSMYVKLEDCLYAGADLFETPKFCFRLTDDVHIILGKQEALEFVRRKLKILRKTT